MDSRWSMEKARSWYDGREWIVGCNFIPSDAGNQLEFWDSETFNLDLIRRELDLAASIGMNALRIFLHDLAWKDDPDGLLARLDSFLTAAAERELAIMPVLFDDCWHEPGTLGLHPGPKPGVHNSMWLRSPGLAAARDPAQRPRLKAYVKAVISTFARDSRVLAWDLYNELGNFFLPALAAPPPARLLRLAATGTAFYLMPIPTLPLFRDVVSWARDIAPDQPLTSSLWISHRGLESELLAASDIVSFHDYHDGRRLAHTIDELETKVGKRPLLCTEYLARTAGSTFESCLPIFEERKVGCFNWGLVAGRTQTIYSWKDGGRIAGEPELWYHDIFRADGSPYSGEEIALLRRVTSTPPSP